MYWDRGRLAFFDSVSGNRRTVPMLALPLVDELNAWTPASALRDRHPELGTTPQIARLLERMRRFGLVEREDRVAPWPWAEWSPEAAFFHFGTRDARYPENMLEHELGLRRKAVTQPQPAPTKTVDGRHLPLPAAASAGELGAVLRERRTWRSLSGHAIDLGTLGTLLGLTFGVQRRGRVEGQGEVVFKTSPSGGARHPIEAYVVANHVTHLRRAVYHYDAATHSLVRVAPAIARSAFVRLMANQFYFGACSAAIVMTACVERTMWRYPYARAYRSVMIEAGHLGQTFCLLATKLELAPFTTIAFQDTALERSIGVDGTAETAVYLVGVGTRLDGASDQPGRIPGRN